MNTNELRIVYQLPVTVTLDFPIASSMSVFQMSSPIFDRVTTHLKPCLKIAYTMKFLSMLYLAMMIREAFVEEGYSLRYDPKTNQQFPILPNDVLSKLSKKYSFPFLMRQIFIIVILLGSQFYLEH
ncbi:hypothetical protein MHZ92_15440 [Sporosarcina sp. ACRSL]|uniref:hypothetical protein n=1 Tax=Sporosarcina sp. ACRSL TaxID=2918215 RepID=UPI001EF51B6C|nr:hypothetical protein [Sporosarcina sp. ACRSL]MCG7345528.1 hypothetical protein [Sporosarcina sp. ACRSL]